jgi:hypothetical protein
MAGILAGLILTEIFASVLSNVRDTTSGLVALFNSSIVPLSHWSGLALVLILAIALVLIVTVFILTLAYAASTLIYGVTYAFNRFTHAPLPKRPRVLAMIDGLVNLIAVAIDKVLDARASSKASPAPVPRPNDLQQPMSTN